MDYLTLEKSLELCKRTLYGKYVFVSKDNVEELLLALPPKYKEVPEGVDVEKERQLVESNKESSRLSPGEFAKLSSEAQDLLFGSSQSAEVVLTELAKCNRKYVKVSSDSGNCLYTSILTQLSDYKDYRDPKDDHIYNTQDFRNQIGYYMATNYEQLFPDLEQFLHNSYHKCALDILCDTNYGDSCTTRVVTEMLGVS